MPPHLQSTLARFTAGLHWFWRKFSVLLLSFCIWMGRKLSTGNLASTRFIFGDHFCQLSLQQTLVSHILKQTAERCENLSSLISKKRNCTLDIFFFISRRIFRLISVFIFVAVARIIYLIFKLSKSCRIISQLFHIVLLSVFCFVLHVMI